MRKDVLRDLEKLGAAGLEALAYLQSRTAPPAGWKEAKLALINAGRETGQVDTEVVVAAIVSGLDSRCGRRRWAQNGRSATVEAAGVAGSGAAGAAGKVHMVKFARRGNLTMSFTLLDWTAIVGYLAITLIMGLWFRRRSGRSVDDYFVSGRNVNWWLAGTSMVATTFAADTPLVVTGLVYSQGISGNWLWWGFLFSGMMTVFLFARLWRRSGLLTDVQFAEIRYSGKPAAFLRGFRAIYLGLLMNCVILGWVTKAMTSIVGTTLADTPMLTNISRFMSAHFGSVWSGNDGAALAICVFFLIPFTGLYVALGGLWGVLWTDLFQFVLKMTIVIAVAYFAVVACGGMTAMLAQPAQNAGRSRRAMPPIRSASSPIFRAASPPSRCGWCRSRASWCSSGCSGGRSGIPARNRAAAATSRSASSARAMRSRDCFRFCGSTSRTTPFGRGLGSSLAWLLSCCIPACSIPKPVT